MDIGEVSKITKLRPSKIRYYEERGLIQSIGRHGLRRVFAPDVVQKLSLIALGQKAGLSLAEIGKMFLPHGLEVDRSLLLDKANEFDKKIIEMTAIRDGLRHAANCPAPRHLECPTFLRLLRVAGQRRYKAGKRQ